MDLRVCLGQGEDSRFLYSLIHAGTFRRRQGVDGCVQSIELYWGPFKTAPFQPELALIENREVVRSGPYQ